MAEEVLLFWPQRFFVPPALVRDALSLRLSRRPKADSRALISRKTYTLILPDVILPVTVKTRKSK